MNTRRPRPAAAQEPIEVDYLGSRGYPLSPHNRAIVLQLITRLTPQPERKVLFRYLDARLLASRR